MIGGLIGDSPDIVAELHCLPLATSPISRRSDETCRGGQLGVVTVACVGTGVAWRPFRNPMTRDGMLRHFGDHTGTGTCAGTGETCLPFCAPLSKRRGAPSFTGE